jgi:hypothetical protein
VILVFTVAVLGWIAEFFSAAFFTECNFTGYSTQPFSKVGRIVACGEEK